MGYTAKRRGKGKAKLVAAPVVEQQDVVMTEVAPNVEKNDGEPSTSAGESSSYLTRFTTSAQSARTSILNGMQSAYEAMSSHKAETLAVAIPVVMGAFNPSFYAFADAAVLAGAAIGAKKLDNRFGGHVQNTASAAGDATLGALKAGVEKAKSVELSKAFTGTPMFNGVFGGAKRKLAEVAKEDTKVAAQAETAKQPAKKRRRHS
jgi:hypothetical protein